MMKIRYCHNFSESIIKQLNNRQTESFYEAIHKGLNHLLKHLKKTKETLTNCFSIQREEQDFQPL
jgi:hypothetical protein